MKRSFFIYLTALLLTVCLCVPAFADEEGPAYAGAGDLDFSSLIESTEESTEGEEGEKPSRPKRPENLEIDETILIADGIYAGCEEGDMVSLGGMNARQAAEAIFNLYDGIGSDAFTIHAGDQDFTTTLYDLGFTFDTSGMVEESVFLGQYGGLIRRYKELTDIRVDKVVFSAQCALDENKINTYVKNNIEILNTDAKNAEITRVNGEFVVAPSVTGWHTNAEATRANIEKVLDQGLRCGMSADAVVELDVPTRTTEALSQIQDRLGSYTTEYASSKDGRKVNIRVGSGNLNGMVVMPGESVSVSTAMKERTPENGYELAGEYLEGETGEAYGGGVCQVATTLYNALLKSEIQIDKRYNHSMLVSYAQPSFDAAISWGTKDLVFTNDTGAPIYIASSCDGATLTFTVYGKEYRSPNHKVVYEAVVVERIPSETIYEEDPNMPADYIEKRGSNHDECVSYLQKMVYEDGELVDTIQFKTDYYNASFQTITQGTIPVSTEDPKPTKERTTKQSTEKSTEASETETAEAPAEKTTAEKTTAEKTTAEKTTEATTKKKKEQKTKEAPKETTAEDTRSAEDKVETGE